MTTHSTQQLISYHKKQLESVFTEIDTITHELNLSEEVNSRSKAIFQQCAEKGLLVGHHIKSIMIAILSYINSRIGNPLMTSTIEKKVNKRLNSEFKWLTKNQLIGNIPIMSPLNYMNRYLTKLKLPLTLEPLCQKVFHCYMENVPNAKNVRPNGIIATVMYLTLLQSQLYHEIRISQDVVASLCEVTPMTIRNRIDDILPFLSLIPEFANFEYEKVKLEKIKCGEEWRNHLI